MFEAQNLDCILGQRVIFEDLSFKIKSGDVLILKGRNGSGKSSLLRILAGLLRPSSGSLLWQGRSVLSELDDHFERCQYVGHLDAIKSALSILENISFWVQVRGYSSDKLTSALQKFEIEDVSDFPARFLSAGQKRRVSLARLIASPAAIWLLDEPAASLDQVMVGHLESMIKNHRNNGGIIVLSTHQDLNLKDTVDLKLDCF